MSATPSADFAEFWSDYDADQEQHQQEREGPKPNGVDGDWPEPDKGVLNLRRREPPKFPIEALGAEWGPWSENAAKAAACPVDYVAIPVLVSASGLIGNARWAQASPGWVEAPHLWGAVVGDSGDGKTPGAHCLQRDVLPELERRMIGDFPERLRDWQAAVAFDKAAMRHYDEAIRAAQRASDPSKLPEMPVPTASEIEPQRPRLRQHDVTIEQVAAILATAAPKGVVIARNELAGWLLGMNAYNPVGRQFWLEAYDGNPYRVERRKHGTAPIDIPRLVVAVWGGTQPDKLRDLITGADDGLLARFLWSWPEPVPFDLGTQTPNAAWAIEALDRLRELELHPGNPPSPIMMPLTEDGREAIRMFGREMQLRRDNSGGLLRSAYGKARGTALRLSLGLEWLWWCAKGGLVLPPDRINLEAFAAGAMLVADYFMPMAERVYGDAAATEIERNAATLARWIVKAQPQEVYVRHLQRAVRLPGLRSAEQIKKAADALVEADWLGAPPKSVFAQGRGRVAYPVNPKVKEIKL
jgi:hypothetical protein